MREAGRERPAWALIRDEAAGPPTGRVLRCEHVPLDAARGVFDTWRSKLDKVPY